MNLNLKGKTVVVTGAAGGMGLATIKLLLDYNVKILALDIQKPIKKILQHKKITYRYFIPSSRTIASNNASLYEYLGIIYYFFKGYI